MLCTAGCNAERRADKKQTMPLAGLSVLHASVCTLGESLSCIPRRRPSRLTGTSVVMGGGS